MKKWMNVFLSTAIFFFGLNMSLVFATQEEEVYTMPTGVVTGTRTEAKVERIPANVTVIDQDDIKNSNAKNTVDLLRYEEGVVVRDLLGNGKNALVDLRGFGETGAFNTLVLVDGRRVNEIDLSGVDWTQIPLEQIERIEIVRGTGSVLYGDNAVGGVINIITKTPSAKPSVTAATLFGSYGRNKDQLSIAGGRDNLAASLYTSYDSTDGYRDNNKFRTKDAGGKVVFDPTDFLSFSLSGSYHSDDFGLLGPLTAEEVDDDRKQTTRPFDEGESTDRYLNLDFELDLGKYGSIVTDLSYRDRESEARFVAFTSATKSDIETWAMTPRYVWDGQILNHANTLVAGVDLYWTDQDGEAFFGSPLEASGLTDIERDSYGFYFNNEFSLFDNLILSLGARSEKVEYDLSQKDLIGIPPFVPPAVPLKERVTERESAYSGGLTFLYGNKSSIFLRTNQSFRFPLTDELIVFDYFAGEIVVNTDLEPQVGKHYELGIKHYFTPDVQGNVTLFRAKIDDEIFFNPVTFANENHPETLRQGVEFGIRADLYKMITIFGNYTYMKALFEDEPFEDNHVPAVPRNKANVGVRIYDIIPGLVLSAEYNYVDESYAISDQGNEFEKLDEYYTIDARISYQSRMLKAFLGVNNLTDQEYSEYAVIGGFPTALNFYPAPERNWIAGLEIVF